MDPIAAASVLPALGWAVHSTLLGRRLATARRDPLTGLLTRAGWTTAARRLIQRAPGALILLIDLDDFKSINDTHGHAAGDAVIATTGRRLATWCHRNGTAGRLGGDEFVAIATDLDVNGAVAALIETLNEPVPYADDLIPVWASVGYCRLADLPVPTLSNALAAADRAMYQAKGSSRRNAGPFGELFDRQFLPAPGNEDVVESGPHVEDPPF
ncbi:GGDEF domain-containing protein [Streptomyces sp. SPB162]|uniref:GGDEF domain-containing protein n=1 Tax=Streptomyces sp. SPB162 TaxID=2940560 RepID=UPI002405DCFC|nr:GGDEF domain-containing protein [Streptomyces sp. SPB162]MDF9817229.1 diguanylate cyclase (GGDEF)-like protein [Streptomyces sp. SPB162]